LDHPNVIKLLDVFAVHKTRLVFEHGGKTLHDYAAGTAGPVIIRTPIMAQLVAGVQHLHRSDVIHRRLQPQKVMTNASSQIRIIDLRGSCVDRPGMRPVLSASNVTPDGLPISALP
jgi:serine/threonine protein kinase